MAEQESPYSRLWGTFKKFASLKIEIAKLSTAEKLTVLLSAAVIALIGLAFGIIILFFLSTAIAELLAKSVGYFWAHMIICGFYALLFAIVVILRKPLILDPVARFISRLFFNPED